MSFRIGEKQDLHSVSSQPAVNLFFLEFGIYFVDNNQNSNIRPLTLLIFRVRTRSVFFDQILFLKIFSIRREFLNDLMDFPMHFSILNFNTIACKLPPLRNHTRG